MPYIRVKVENSTSLRNFSLIGHGHSFLSEIGFEEGVSVYADFDQSGMMGVEEKDNFNQVETVAKALLKRD